MKSREESSASTVPEDQEVVQQEHNSESEAHFYKDQIVRITADFDNFRRRTEKERLEWGVISKVALLKKILPLFDDLDRAINAIDQNSDAQLIKEGFVLIQKNIAKTLGELGVVHVDAHGPFDPSRHEALMQVEDSQLDSGHIVTVFEKGYMLQDHIIRYAKVSVAK